MAAAQEAVLPEVTEFLSQDSIRMFIGGRWEESADGGTFQTLDPGTGAALATVAEGKAADVDRAVRAARKAFNETGWATMPVDERAARLRRLADLLDEHRDILAQLESLDVGKPFEVARDGDIPNAPQTFRWYADFAAGNPLRTSIPVDGFEARQVRFPYGVAAFVLPWNFPFLLLGWNLAPALAAGNTVVLKPAEDTPLSALALAELAKDAGIPDGVLNVVTCKDPTEVGKALTDSPTIRKLSFTGSTAVGRKLFADSSDTVKELCLELGGNCPAIVFKSAVLDKAAQSIASYKFHNRGQCCNSINRILVQESVCDAFISKLEAEIKNIPTGPLINEQGASKVEELVEDALSKGAKLILGGKRDGLSYAPTLLTGVTSEMRMSQEEIFGPVAPIYTFKTEEEALEMANGTEYGLAAYFFTEEIWQGWRVAEQLEAGTIGMNTTKTVSEITPFGGWKQSGVGREGGVVDSLNGYCELKTVVTGGIEG